MASAERAKRNREDKGKKECSEYVQETGYLEGWDSSMDRGKLFSIMATLSALAGTASFSSIFISGATFHVLWPLAPSSQQATQPPALLSHHMVSCFLQSVMRTLASTLRGTCVLYLKAFQSISSGFCPY